jgi:hypothetical protein
MYPGFSLVVLVISLRFRISIYSFRISIYSFRIILIASVLIASVLDSFRS